MCVRVYLYIVRLGTGRVAGEKYVSGFVFSAETKE